MGPRAQVKAGLCKEQVQLSPGNRKEGSAKGRLGSERTEPFSSRRLYLFFSTKMKNSIIR